MISIDTETTGLDISHGARPYLVTICKEDDYQLCWEWPVDPLTREVQYDQDDFQQIREIVEQEDEVVGQNIKFDVKAMRAAGLIQEWPWEKTHDTIIAEHVIASNKPHDLTKMAWRWLGKVGKRMRKAEDEMQEACEQARKMCRRDLKDWMIAKEGLPTMPSAKEKCWKYDTWLPKCLLNHVSPGDEDHPWHSVTTTYANLDSAATLAIWKLQRRELMRRDLWEIYLWQLYLVPIIFDMEARGVTVSKKRMRELEHQYLKSSTRCHEKCVSLSGGVLERLPVNGASDALREVIFDRFRLPTVRVTDKGNPSMDKYAIDEWLVRLDEGSDPHEFLSNLKAYRKRQTALGYIESYKRFLIDDVLHSSLNQTGTDTLRMSMSSPNGQQVSKQDIVEEEVVRRNGLWWIVAHGEPLRGPFTSRECAVKAREKESHSARYMFGPAPGREWWCMDYENLELRIPAYKASEKLMIDLFERPNDPPYFGSNHLLFAHILHGRQSHSKTAGMFEECCTVVGQDGRKWLDGRKFKEVYGDTWYSWTKNGDFAVQYGAVATSGTADKAYHVPGGQSLIENRLTNIKAYSRRQIEFANKTGYVETVPDVTVNPRRGYPLLCTRTERGNILETVPLSYHIQGTAMWCTRKAMVRCQSQLNYWNATDSRGYWMVLQVHDELVFDFPALPDMGNLPKARKLQMLMEESGDDIQVPLKVSVKLHREHWAKGMSV